MRSFLTYIFIFIFSLLTQMGIAQEPTAVPLTENTELKPAQDIQASSIPTYRVHVLTQSNKQWCIPDEFSFDPIDSLWQRDCGMSEIETTISDSCLIITTTSIIQQYRDTLCFTAKTVMGDEIPFQLDVIVNPAYGLPFIEDFSEQSVYPDDYKWQDNDVYVNNTLAQNPPSLGVATFDGLNSSGNPYGSGYGRSDYLTSNHINLEGAPNPHIRFWYQARGLGFEGYPRPKDSLILEFKTSTGTWNKVWSTAGIGSDQTVEFQSVSIQIPPVYFNKNFQFRFVNYSDNNGMLSFWHVDYIFITKNENNLNNIQDIAFTQEAQPLLTPYRSMPYVHFEGNEDKYVRDSITIKLFNHFNSIQSANPSDYIVKRPIDGEVDTLLNETLLEVVPIVDENQRDLSPGRHTFTNRIKLRSSDLIPGLKQLDLNSEDYLRISSEMYFENSNENSQLNSNNFTNVYSHLKNYYAYDDGTAEVGIHIPAGTVFPTVLQKFTTETEDTLKALQYHFPHIKPNVTNQRFRIVVYSGELDGDSEPIYEETLDQAIFASTHYDSLSGFTTFALKEDGENIGLVIPEGDFYVGWQQISSNTQFGVYIGFDKNSPSVTRNGNILYNNDGATWQVFDNNVQGALMIRPVFGQEHPISTSITDIKNLDELKLYPNPTNQYLNIRGENLKKLHSEIHVFSILGQKVIEKKFQDRIFIGDLPSGKYLINIRNQNGRITHEGKFIISN